MKGRSPEAGPRGRAGDAGVAVIADAAVTPFRLV